MNNGANAHQEALKRPRWDDRSAIYATSSGGGGGVTTLANKMLLGLSGVSVDAIVPHVTVVLEGRCICHRIQLSGHAGYQSLAAALRRMFVDVGEGGEGRIDEGLDLSNAVPGHVVAYEDMEDDLLLAGDLNWKDFVRVVKRIRIIPAKAMRRHCTRA